LQYTWSTWKSTSHVFNHAGRGNASGDRVASRAVRPAVYSGISVNDLCFIFSPRCIGADSSFAGGLADGLVPLLMRACG
jgi:hypothetical protein